MPQCGIYLNIHHNGKATVNNYASIKWQPKPTKNLEKNPVKEGKNNLHAFAKSNSNTKKIVLESTLVSWISPTSVLYSKYGECC